MDKYKNLLTNIALFTLNTVSTKLITFFLIPLYTFYLSTREFGISDMALTVISLVTPIVTVSINDAVVRYIIDDSGNQGKYVTVGFWVTSLGCLITILALPLLDFSIFGGLGQYKSVFAVTFVVVAFQGLFSNAARGLNQTKLFTWVSIISSLITAATAGLMIGPFQLGIYGYFYSMIAGNVVGVILYLIVGHHYRYISLLDLKSNKSIIRSMLSFAIPMMPNAVFWWIGTSVNRFFITSMLGVGFSGLFAAAGKIPNVMNMLSTTFWQAWSLSAFQEYRKTNVSMFFTNVFIVFRALSAVVGSLIILTSPILAKFLLQKDFYEAWTLIPMLVLAFYFNVLSGFYGTVFTASMKTKYLLTTTGAAAVVVIVFTWILVPKIGLQGASVAMALSNLIMLVLRILQARMIIQIKVKWPLEIGTVVTMLIQVLVMANKVPHFLIYSSILCLAIVVLKTIETIPSIRTMLRKSNITVIPR
jgi:O-antigen/teichoic acid export membrane protein